MSIYCTSLSFADGEHQDGCAIYYEESPGVWEFSGEPCDCGTPWAPLVYQGSHFLPSDSNPKGGDFAIADIPDFIERNGRDDAQGHGLKDWLRVDMIESPDTYGEQAPGQATVILTRKHAEALRDWLTGWLDREPLGWP